MWLEFTLQMTVMGLYCRMPNGCVMIAVQKHIWVFQLQIRIPGATWKQSLMVLCHVLLQGACSVLLLPEALQVNRTNSILFPSASRASDEMIKKWLNFGVHFCWLGIMCMLSRYNIPCSKSAMSRHQAFWLAFYHVTMIFNYRSHRFPGYYLVVFLVWN